MIRRISGLLAALATSATLVLAPTTAAQAAAAELEILNAGLTNLYQPVPDLYIVGTYACAEPTGDAEISLLALQTIGGISVTAGDITVPCEDGPVTWEAEFAGGYDLHPGFIMISGTAKEDGEIQDLASESFTLT